MKLKTLLKNTGIAMVILIVTFPAAFMITIITFPFWRWLEEITWIESYGHSGPADWCFWLVYLLLIIVAGMFWMAFRNQSKT